MNPPPHPAAPAIAILGPGLLGGSLAMAIRARHPGTRVTVWARRQEAADDVLRRGIADQAATDIATAVRGASLIILATPVETMPAQAAQIAAAGLAPGTLVTDVGSVKGSIVAALDPIISGGGGIFIGSHPMAGSEKTGIEDARADLFKGAACILTPGPRTPPGPLERLADFWRSLGARVILRAPADHDRHVARISHLPHLIAAVTTRAALSGDPAAAECTGKGFRDATRIAAGDPGLWTHITLQNRAEILAALRDAGTQLAQLVEIIEKLDEEPLRAFLAAAKSLRDSVPPAAA